MNIAGLILRIAGWKVSVTVPDYDKCIICVAPHTSNWDFLLGKLAYASVHRKAGFLMKESWFFFPLGYLLKAIGGVPVPRGRGNTNLVQTLVDRFNSVKRLQIAITPEGTRSKVDKWHTGFLRIAYAADNVHVVLGAIDYKFKTITVDNVFKPSGDIQYDINAVKDFYRNTNPHYPDKFSTIKQ